MILAVNKQTVSHHLLLKSYGKYKKKMPNNIILVNTENEQKLVL